MSNKDVIDRIIRNSDKKIIVVTNTPYRELSIPEHAENVVITFATSPENIKVTAGVLFGVVSPEGEWPLEERMWQASEDMV